LERLTTEDHYRSPELPVSRVAGSFPSLLYYWRAAPVVLKASRLAKRGRYTREAWVHSSLGIVRALESVGVRFEVENIGAFKSLDRPCVFIGNHMSTLETFALPCIIQPYRDVTYVVKKSLVVAPVFKHVMISRDPVVVGRTNPKEDLRAVLDGGPERLGRNVSIIVFPQTTRSTRLEGDHFNSIGVKLARRAGVPVIPIALKTDAWGLGRLVKDIGPVDPSVKVRFAFGDPLEIQGNGKEEHDAVLNFISDRLNEWGREGEGS
jgi:1-acyl-sn-glycerol-3-phosphate acyltransferase